MARSIGGATGTAKKPLDEKTRNAWAQKAVDKGVIVGKELLMTFERRGERLNKYAPHEISGALAVARSLIDQGYAPLSL